MPSTPAQHHRDFPRTLVLGASGRLGSILQRCWRGKPVSWHARSQPEAQYSFDPVNDKIEMINAFGAHDVVLCLSGVTPGNGDLSQNAQIAESVLHAADAAGGPVVLLCSSAAVYGKGGFDLRETQPTQPISAYGQAKLDMEQVAKRLGAQLGVRTCALRIGNVAGADAILGNWQPGFQLDQFPDGSTPLRSYIGPADLAACLHSLLRRATDLPITLNLARPDPVQMGELLDAAGYDWHPRPASTNCIKAVCLNTERLDRFHEFARTQNSVSAIIDDWISYRDGGG
jgi:nucleoside-diphosphate-sugar epimerase